MWQYWAVSIDDSHEDVNEVLKTAAENGWELINGSTATYTTKMFDSPTAPLIYHIKFTMFWRRPMSQTA
jgi:hypothetical protein